MSQRNAGAVTASPGPGRDAEPDGPPLRARPTPVVLLPRRRPGHLGPVHVMQLLLVEAALVAIAVAIPYGPITTVAVAAGAALLLGTTLARSKGRWWVERRLMAWQFQRRRRAAPGPAHGEDPRLAVLRVLAPGLDVADVTLTDGSTRVGVARDDAGWYAVAAVTASAPLAGGAENVPLEMLADALAEADQPGAVLQLVTHTLPAPSIDTHPSSPAGHSYRQLLSRFGNVAVPADRAVWIAVRLDAHAVARVVGNDPTELNRAPAVVAALLRRVAKSLQRVGISHRLLDADGLLHALTRSCDLEPAGQPEPTRPREEWTEWHSVQLAHRSYWVRGWPPPEQAAGLLDALSSAQAAMTSVALIVSRDDDSDLMDLRGLVRVAAPAGALNQVCQAVTRGAQQARADLFQLDGEQGPAVYASAPTGGGAR